MFYPLLTLLTTCAAIAARATAASVAETRLWAGRKAEWRKEFLHIGAPTARTLRSSAVRSGH